MPTTAIRERRECQVDLYPPGLDRVLTFEPGSDEVVIRCRSWRFTEWTPDSETISRQDLLTMLNTLAADFGAALKMIGSDLAEIAPFDGWTTSVT